MIGSEMSRRFLHLQQQGATHAKVSVEELNKACEDVEFLSTMKRQRDPNDFKSWDRPVVVGFYFGVAMELEV